MSESPRIARMTCPGCGAEMNPHAEKPVVPMPDVETSRVDWALGVLLEEVHQCPACGWVESRRVV
jgi:predicted RNA-binding Zn-ribbon protein involved in translation (DUF1610 family)